MLRISSQVAPLTVCFPEQRMGRISEERLAYGSFSVSESDLGFYSYGFSLVAGRKFCRSKPVEISLLLQLDFRPYHFTFCPERAGHSTGFRYRVIGIDREHHFAFLCHRCLFVLDGSDFHHLVHIGISQVGSQIAVGIHPYGTESRCGMVYASSCQSRSTDSQSLSMAGDVVDVHVPVYPGFQIVSIQVDGHALSGFEHMPVFSGPIIMIKDDNRFPLGNLRQVVHQPVIHILFGIARPIIASPHGGDNVVYIAHIE